MRKLVGTYDLGMHPVKLFIDTELDGGRFNTSNDSHVGEMVVGMSDEWSVMMEVLMHESFEALALSMELRFSPSVDYSESSSNCIFVMTHEQMGEIIARVGKFMADCLESFARAYRKLLAERKP